MSARFAASAALFSLLCFAHAAAAECTKDTDCKGSRVCEQGQCVADEETPGEADNSAATTETAASTRQSSDETQRDDYPPLNTGGTRRRSTGLMVTGIVFTATGAFSGLVALSLIINRMKCNDPNEALVYDKSTCDTLADLTLATAIGFVAFAGVGVPMIIIGAGRVPNQQATRRLMLTPWASAHSGGLSLSGNF